MKNIVLLVVGAVLLMPATPKLGLAKAPSAITPPTSVQQPAEPKSQTFTGTILKNGNKFVLTDSANKLSYMLDDGKKASEFEGKKVKVTGTVDMASNTIYVETIQEIA